MERTTLKVSAPFVNDGAMRNIGEEIEIHPTKARLRLLSGDAEPPVRQTCPIAWLPEEGASIFDTLQAMAATYPDLLGTPVSIDGQQKSKRLRLRHYGSAPEWAAWRQTRRGGSGGRANVGDVPETSFWEPAPQPPHPTDIPVQKFLIDHAVVQFRHQLESGIIVGEGIYEDDLKSLARSPIAPGW